MADYLIRCKQCQATVEAVREPSNPLDPSSPEHLLPPKGWIGTTVSPGTRFALVQPDAFCSFACVRAWAKGQERLALEQAAVTQPS